VSAPTPVRVDELAKAYMALKDEYLEARLEAETVAELLEKKAAELKALVSDFGSAHAEKSKLLHGVTHELMVTFGSSVSIDGAAVEKFRLALVAAKKARVLRKLFEKTIRWTLSPLAPTLIKGERQLPQRLLALYAQCEVVKQKTPSLTVREKT
jgi:hypothetical protein